MSEFFELIVDGEPLVYKGVSYNPMIGTYGENFNILDFFGWLKAGGFRGIVLDASLYGVVNAAQALPTGAYSEKAAEEAVAFLDGSIDRYTDIKISAGVRSKYLRATSISMFPTYQQPLVVDANMLWASKRYAWCLQEAIKFCCDNPEPGSKLEILKYANYTRYNTPYQRWYSVLVLAEALYLYEVYGVNVKLGPTTETNFDSLIREFMKSRGIRYGFIWYDRNVEKQVAYPDLLSFNDSEKEQEKKLGNTTLAAWVDEILLPFREGRMDTRTQVADTIRRINAVAETNPQIAIPEGGWFVMFPPGSCN